jgi:hypothetical protein
MRRRLSKDEANAMTVNERLFASGLVDDFDEAVAQGNVSELERILRDLYLPPESIEATISQVMASSKGD